MVDLTERARVNVDIIPASIVSTPGMSGLCGFFLNSSHEDDKPANIAYYRKPTLDKCQAIHNHIYKAYLAVFMILILERSIYGKIIEELSNYYYIETEQYPWTRAKMHNTIVHSHICTTRYGLRAPPGAIVFSQDNSDGRTSIKMYANNIQREPRDLSKVKCFK